VAQEISKLKSLRNTAVYNTKACCYALLILYVTVSAINKGQGKNERNIFCVIVMPLSFMKYSFTRGGGVKCYIHYRDNGTEMCASLINILSVLLLISIIYRHSVPT
jgi:hypothetical protein